MKSRMWTVGSIAKRLGVELHRVEYLIDAREIEPVGRAGIARVFDDAAVERIESELQRIEATREGGNLVDSK